MIKGILFDVDGTLILSNDAHAHSWVEAFAHFGYTVKYDDVRPLIGMGSDKIIPFFFPELQEDKAKGKEISQMRGKIFRTKYLPTLSPAPGAYDLVKYFSEKEIKMVTASSASEKDMDQLLDTVHVKEFLHTTTSSSDVQNSKPDSDIVREALNKIQLPADEVLLIGDTPYDIEASEKCGVPVIAVRCGGFPDSTLSGAKQIYDDPADVLKNIEEILQSG